MLSLSNVSAGQAETYYSKDNYYTGGSKETTGEWFGAGSEKLGLNGAIDKESFGNVLHGKSADGAEQLVNRAERNVDGRVQEARAAVDLTFSAPKSVSIMGVVDSRIQDAHDSAVRATLEMVEKKYMACRSTKDGVTIYEQTDNMVAAVFRDDLSRERDPQIHSHAVVQNLTQREDGSWRALSNDQLFEHRNFIGQTYRNELASNLRDIGYEVLSDNRGLFEIAGVPSDLIQEFSQRSAQIEAQMGRLRDLYPAADDSKLREMACLSTREAKQTVDHAAMIQSHRDRIKARGYSEVKLQALTVAAGKEFREARAQAAGMNEYDYVRASYKAAEASESVFSKEDILKAAGQLSVGDQRMGDLDRAFNELISDKEILQLGKNAYTTQQMQQWESRIKHAVIAGKNTQDEITTLWGVMHERGLYAGKTGVELSDGQRQAAAHILTNKDQFMAVTGLPGVGKTRVLHFVRDVVETNHGTIRGMSFTGKAAEEIQRASGINSTTVDSFLRSPQTGETGQIWVVDEATQLGSKKMNALVQRATMEDAKVVFLGDTGQLQAIEAGALFDRLLKQNLIGTVHMDQIMRQTGEYREVVRAMAERNVDGAMDKITEQGRVIESRHRAALVERMRDDYIEAGYKNTAIVTPDNCSRSELNAQIHNMLKERGEIGGKELDAVIRQSKGLGEMNRHFAQSYAPGDLIYSRRAGVMGQVGTEARVRDVDRLTHTITAESRNGQLHEIDLKQHGRSIEVYVEHNRTFCEGERVAFGKNDKSLSVQNGQVGIVEKISGNTMTVNVEGQMVGVNLDRYAYVDHAYAGTVYKAQGMTTQNVMYDAQSGNTSYQEAHVAMSRGKEILTVYTDNAEALRQRMKEELVKSSTLDYELRHGIDPNNHDRGPERDAGITEVQEVAPSRHEHQINETRHEQAARLIDLAEKGAEMREEAETSGEYYRNTRANSFDDTQAERVQSRELDKLMDPDYEPEIGDNSDLTPWSDSELSADSEQEAEQELDDELEIERERER